MLRRSHAIVLRTFAVWTIWGWGTRLWNIVEDPDHSASFKAVHSGLALVSIALAVAALVIVSRNRRPADPAGGDQPEPVEAGSASRPRR